MKNILFIFTLFITFTACGDKQAVTDVLNRAEVLMNEQPDSSLALLRTLTFDDFQKESNRARYALLHSQALDKNYIDVTNDSLISVAVEYYKDKDDVRSKFLAYYYMGRVYANGERYLQATTCLMESEQLVDKVNDDYLSGLLYSEMGRIYRLYYDFPKSLAAYQKAAECYERAGKISHRNYMWFYQSQVCCNMSMYDESERLLLKTLALAKEEGDDVLVKSCVGDLVMLFVELNRTMDALSLYNQSALIHGEFGTSSFMGVLSRLYASEREFVIAQNCLEKGWNRAKNRNDSVSLYLSSAMLSDKMGDGKKAYQELLKGVSMQNVNVLQSLEQPILTVQRDYLSDRLEFQSYKLRMEKHLRILYVLIFVLLLSAVVWMLLRKLRVTKENARKTIDGLNDEMLRKDKENHQRVTDLLQELEQKDQVTANSLAALRAALEQQEADYRQYIHRMEKMMNRYRVMYGSSEPMTEEEILCWKTLCRIVKSNIYQPEKDREHLIYYLDTYRNGFAGRLRQAYPALKKERLLDVCYLFAIGLTVEQMAKMFNIGERTVEHYMTDICQETVRKRVIPNVESGDLRTLSVPSDENNTLKNRKKAFEKYLTCLFSKSWLAAKNLSF